MLGFGDQIWLLLFSGYQIYMCPPNGKQNFDSNLKVYEGKKILNWIQFWPPLSHLDFVSIVAHL
jgi:hypothetical protein